MKNTAVFSQLASTLPPWTISDLARYLRCTERQTFHLRNKGLPAIKVRGVVRFDPSAVRSWLLQHGCESTNRQVAKTEQRPAELFANHISNNP